MGVDLVLFTIFYFIDIRNMTQGLLIFVGRNQSIAIFHFICLYFYLLIILTLFTITNDLIGVIYVDTRGDEHIKIHDSLHFVTYSQSTDIIN